MPVIFDLVERKAIWVDLITKSSYCHGGNNIHSNKATIEETLEAIISMKNKISLYELFNMHAKARGEIVENREEADTVFSTYEGDVTPYNISIINDKYLA